MDEPNLNQAMTWLKLGNQRFFQNEAQAAIGAYREAIRLRPDWADAWNNLGTVLERTDQLSEAVECYRQSLRLNPGSADTHQNLGVALCRGGRVEEGVTCYRQAILLKPDSPQFGSQLVYTLLHQPGLDEAVIFQEHLAWARRHAEPLAGQIRPHDNDRQANRRLRIGYVSANFRQHAVGFFIEPVLAHHNHDRFEVFCYSDFALEDSASQRMQKSADRWLRTAGLTDEQLAEQVRQDRIDILVDLSGHLPNNRLLTFARKPAPVQVTYLGYQATTGLSAMDYRLTDAVADPPGSTEGHYTERLVRLPIFFCYRPSEESPPPGPPPAQTNRFVTFGSMNSFVKINPGVIRVSAQLVQTVEGSRLMILLPGGETGNGWVRQAFADAGVDPNRIELTPTQTHLEYLKLFHRIDIALDPFPFGGHTTTCDSIWMGVPTVVMSGPEYRSRMNVSVLSHLGQGQWIATDADKYVEIAAGLAADRTGLVRLHAQLRRQMQESPLTDAPRFARSLEDAYRQMWHAFCG